MLKAINQNFFGRDEHFNPVIVRSVNDISGLVLEVKIKDFSQNNIVWRIIKFKSRKILCSLTIMSKLSNIQNISIKKG